MTASRGYPDNLYEVTVQATDSTSKILGSAKNVVVEVTTNVEDRRVRCQVTLSAAPIAAAVGNHVHRHLDRS